MSETAHWNKVLAPYTRPRIGRSVLDLATSVVPYLGLTALLYALYGDIPWWALALIMIPTGGFMLRTFIVFHDCGHGSFMPTKEQNRWVGRFTALLVWQPFENWRFDHAVHHGTAGDLDRRGQGDVPTLTVDEYYSKGLKGRLGYRLFRSPLVMFGIGPIYSLMVAPRLSRADKRDRLRNSIYLTNVGVVALAAGQCLLFGVTTWLVVAMVTGFIAAAAGVWLFYVQHQFEDVYWENTDQWSYSEAALSGSSYLKLPKLLQFFTGNIGLHHVHHLSAKIPNYNLQRAHDENEVFHQVPVLGLRDSFRCIRLKLIDPDSGRLLTWSQARELMQKQASGSRAVTVST